MTADDDYANSAYIPQGDSYLGRWSAAASAFRDGHTPQELGVAYGPAARQTYDMFHPNRSAKGTVVFVHGGYWMALGPRDFSHLAAGTVRAGYACALPSYTLAPDARIAQMTLEIAQAIGTIARRTVGPLYLVGHSAGGHLVARMACRDRAEDWSGRVARVMSVSGLSDLAPLMQTSMNATLGIDAPEAEAESPVRQRPQEIPVTAWVGGGERPAFLEQSLKLAQSWGCGHVIEPERHHFDVIEGLEDPASAMMRTLLSAP